MRDDGLGPFRGCVTALLLALALWAVLALVAWIPFMFLLADLSRPLPLSLGGFP